MNANPDMKAWKAIGLILRESLLDLVNFCFLLGEVCVQKKTQKNLETNYGISTTIEMKTQVQSTKRRRRLSETKEETR